MFFFSRDDSICSCKRDSQTKSGFFEGEMYVYTWLFRIYEYTIYYMLVLYILYIFIPIILFSFRRWDSSQHFLERMVPLAAYQPKEYWQRVRRPPDGGARSLQLLVKAVGPHSDIPNPLQDWGANWSYHKIHILAHLIWPIDSLRYSWGSKWS